ncbi:hypothetical protein J3E72DRAFT_267802 [Bipolaris maydis]|nr:hypothetical protein J3E72DRAFT_267802 [Bipolaris maydis]
MPGAAGIYSRMKQRERRALGVEMLVHISPQLTSLRLITAIAVADKLLLFSTGYEHGVPLDKMVSPSITLEQWLAEARTGLLWTVHTPTYVHHTMPSRVVVGVGRIRPAAAAAVDLDSPGLLPTTWNLSKGKGLGKVVICQSLILRSSVLPCRQTHGDDAEERHSVMSASAAHYAPHVNDAHFSTPKESHRSPKRGSDDDLAAVDRSVNQKWAVGHVHQSFPQATSSQPHGLGCRSLLATLPSADMKHPKSEYIRLVWV